MSGKASFIGLDFFLHLDCPGTKSRVGGRSSVATPKISTRDTQSAVLRVSRQ